MVDQEYDLSVALIIVGVILSSFAIFLLYMMFVFAQRVIKHRSQISHLKSDQNKELLRSTIQTQENERKRIGANIHDDIGPMLSALKLQIGQISDGTNNEEGVSQVQDCKNVIDDIITEVRRISRDLVPSVLYELGLEESLDYFVHRLRKLNIANVKYEKSAPLSRLNKGQSLAIYRIVQEGLNNIIKHAQATEIEIALTTNGSVLEIKIVDNGVGFDEAQVTDGLGLKNIQARLETFNGKYKFSSQENKGTTLFISMQMEYES